MTSLAQRITPITKKLSDNKEQFTQGKIKSVPYSDKRCALLIEGLTELATHFNFPAAIRYESTGEYTFNGNADRNKEEGCAPFGEGLAKILSSIYTRTGVNPSIGHVMAENGWTRINHFEVEKLLYNLAEERHERETSTKKGRVVKC